MEQTGIIVNIQHYSVHDGPGIRTVVFFKGCPLSCRWCSNPESQKRQCQMAWNREKCIGCGSCVEELKDFACRFEGTGGLHWQEPSAKDADRIDWKKVDLVCPAAAFHVFGKKWRSEEILKEVKKDAVFYGNSGGGITLSGGEPLMQPSFAAELLKKAGSQGIHRAMETSGYAPFEVFRETAEQLDYLLMDIKAYDDGIHKKYTGVSNRIILENLRKIRREFPELPIHVRTPVIPGVNDSEKEIGKIADYVRQFSNIRYELLKYHRYGLPKYEMLRREYDMGDDILSDGLFANLKQFEFAYLD